MLLEGKKAIITGGTRGIGYAIACRFIEEGAAVTVFGSRQETADAAVEKLTTAYPEAKVWGRSCDLTSLEAVTKAFTQAAADMGGLDTVVNNAGISQRSPLLDYTAEEFAKVMDLNVVAVFNGHQAAAKIMTEAGHGGTITTTSSMVAKYGQPSGVGYPTSKFAVNGMVQSLSRELAPMGIRVNAVAPGVTKTDMVANLPEEVIKPIIATIPLGRMGEPEDIANAFVFLASDMSSYVTGAVLPVDGAARSYGTTNFVFKPQHSPNKDGVLPASTAGSTPSSVCMGNHIPVFRGRTGRSFPQGLLSETMSHSGCGFWDAVSQRGLLGKPHPRIQPNNGPQFPADLPQKPRPIPSPQTGTRLPNES